jgi:hypothetical protein
MFEDHIITLEEGQRQILLLALAKLSIERPGWLDAIERIAFLMDNRTMQGKPELLYEFRRIHNDTAGANCSRLLDAASHALRSYEHGNSSPELAKEIADAIDLEIGPAPGVPE